MDSTSEGKKENEMSSPSLSGLDNLHKGSVVNGSTVSVRTLPRVSFADSTDTNIANGSSAASNGYSTTKLFYSASELLNISMIEKYTSCRWIITFMCFLMVTCSMLLRQCMSMAVVCIESNYFKVMGQTGVNQSNNTFNNSMYSQEEWVIFIDSEMEGLILTSYFYTLPLTSVIGGYLSGKFSGKKVVAAMTIVLIVASFLIPISAVLNPYIVVGLRCVIGLSSGGLQPAITAMLSRWAPRSERAQIVAVANAGMMIGSVMTFSLSGFICLIPLHNGWPFIFYIFGIVNCIAILLWFFLVYDRPDEHPRVTWKERALINYKRRDSTLEKMPSPPWLRIVTSGPFWGLLLGHMAHGFISTTIGTFLPLYMNDVLKFDIAANGLLSSLPSVGRFLVSIFSGMLADNLITKGYLSITKTRKIFHAGGIVLSSPFIIGMSYMDQSQKTYAVVLLVAYWSVQSLNNAGFRVNHIDIAPRFAGVLNGLTTTMACTASLISPIVTAELTKNGTREEWQVVFFICVGVGLGGALAFVVLGSGEEQDWAKDPNMNMDLSIYCSGPDINDGYSKNYSEETSNSTDLAISNKDEILNQNSQNEDINEIGVNNVGTRLENSVTTKQNKDHGSDNEAFNDVDIQDIIGHVKLLSSFRSAARDVSVNVRHDEYINNSQEECNENSAETCSFQIVGDNSSDTHVNKEFNAFNAVINESGKTNAVNHSGDKLESHTSDDSSHIHIRTRFSRENMRIILPNIDRSTINFLEATEHYHTDGYLPRNDSGVVCTHL